jgi:hypothetical protein
VMRRVNRVNRRIAGISHTFSQQGQVGHRLRYTANRITLWPHA